LTTPAKPRLILPFICFLKLILLLSRSNTAAESDAVLSELNLDVDVNVDDTIGELDDFLASLSCDTGASTGVVGGDGADIGGEIDISDTFDINLDDL